MSLTFTKLFSSITESTVWCEPAHTRLVWITMLAMADRKGRVWASVPGLANRARVPVEDTEKALATFMAPDRYSRTPEYDGRRIEPIDGGWRLLNHAKYRDIRDEEERREQNREAQERHRKKSADPLTVSHGKPGSAQAEAEAYTEAEADSTPKAKAKPKVAAMPLPVWLNAELWGEYVEKCRPKKARDPKMLQGCLEDLEKWRSEGQDPNEIVRRSFNAGWRLLKPIDVKRANGGRPSVAEANRAAAEEFARRGGV